MRRVRTAPNALGSRILLLIVALIATTPHPASAARFSSSLHDLATPSLGRFHTVHEHRSAPAVLSTLPNPDTGIVGSPTRQLLHGALPPQEYPRCPQCKLISCVGNWWFGHCRAGGTLYNCKRRKPPSAAPSTPFPQNLTATAPYVACLEDSDCSLPFDLFASVNRSSPLNVTGQLRAECQLPTFPPGSANALFGDHPGICMCKYLGPTTADDVIDLAIRAQAGETLAPEDTASLTAGLARDFCFQRPVGGASLPTHPAHPFFVPETVLELPELTGVEDGAGGDGEAEPAVLTFGSIAALSVIDGYYDFYEMYENREEPVGVAVETPGPGPPLAVAPAPTVGPSPTVAPAPAVETPPIVAPAPTIETPPTVAPAPTIEAAPAVTPVPEMVAAAGVPVPATTGTDAAEDETAGPEGSGNATFPPTVPVATSPGDVFVMEMGVLGVSGNGTVNATDSLPVATRVTGRAPAAPPAQPPTAGQDDVAAGVSVGAGIDGAVSTASAFSRNSSNDGQVRLTTPPPGSTGARADAGAFRGMSVPAPEQPAAGGEEDAVDPQPAGG